VCTTWLIHDKRYYLIDVLRDRFEFPTLRRRAVQHARQYNPRKILVEDDLLGKALVGELKDAGLSAIAVKPEANKKTRMKIQSAKFESGLVYFPKQAPWLGDYEGEVFAFPNTRFDDQVDSTAQALACDHSSYNPKAIADGMDKFLASYVFQRSFGGHIF
jgi:predicted phage terminase large subunit-like protein